MRKISLLTSFLLAFGALTLTTNANAYVYSITNLGSLGNTSEALGISDNGYIVGDSDTNNGLRATLFSASGNPTALTPGNHNPFARSYGVNDSGQAVGLAVFSPWGMHAAIFNPGGSTLDLGTLGGDSSQANAINNSGQVVGISSTTNGMSHATLFGLGQSPLDLGALPGGNWSNATAINNLGVIAGASQSGWGAHATLFSTASGPIDLDPLATSATSSAFGLSDNGLIVGVRQYAGWTPTLGNTTIQRAAQFDIGLDPLDLGDLGGSFSRSYDVNSAGQIVGSSTIVGDEETHAALFGIGQTPIDLNDLIDPLSGWTLREATAINERGDIVGYGVFNGSIRAFLATPVSEPESLPLILCGLLSLVAVSRKRHSTI